MISITICEVSVTRKLKSTSQKCRDARRLLIDLQDLICRMNTSKWIATDLRREFKIFSSKLIKSSAQNWLNFSSEWIQIRNDHIRFDRIWSNLQICLISNQIWSNLPIRLDSSQIWSNKSWLKSEFINSSNQIWFEPDLKKELKRSANEWK